MEGIEQRGRFGEQLERTLMDGYNSPRQWENSFKYFFTPSFSISSSLNVFKLANKGL
jgi:hypothetical protein